MFCRKCGKELRDNAKFCPYCGNSTGELEPQRNVQYEANNLDNEEKISSQYDSTRNKEKISSQYDSTHNKEKISNQYDSTHNSENYAMGRQTKEKDKKSGSNKLLLGLIAVGVAIIVILVGVIAVIKSDSIQRFNKNESEPVAENTESTDAEDILSQDISEEEIESLQISSEETVEETTEAVTESSTSVEEVTKEEDPISVSDSGEWREAYAQTILTDTKYYFKYALIDLDGNSIPELFCESDVVASGLILFSYYNGEVVYNSLEFGSVWYMEGQNSLYATDGHMAVYGDTIYHLDKGELVKDIGGWYGLEDNRITTDENGNPMPYVYYWNNEEITEEKYNFYVESFFDKNRAKQAEGIYNYEEMVDLLQPQSNNSLPAQNDDFIFPTSDSEYLTMEDLEALTPKQIRLARNEIYARRGYIFKDEFLKEYFESKDWYTPSVDKITDDMFNEYEIANRDLIVQYEEQ